jgi:UDP:flavonoid glycosyltransferase YjiC (YdhE family)
MRILMMISAVPTHFNPLVPLAWALRAAGHTIVIAAQPDVQNAIRGAGFEGVCKGTAFNVEDHLQVGLDGRRPIEARPRPEPDILVGFGKVWLEQTMTALDGYLDYARTFRPDLIISDPMEYASMIAAGALDVPVVHHRWGVDPISDPARRWIRPRLDEVCAALGLDSPPEPAMLLDPCPPTLQMPQADPATPIRFVPYNGGGTVPTEILAKTRPRRLVVSVGHRTLILNGVPLMRTILHACDGLEDTEVIATVGEADRAEIGAVPPNVRMVDPLPLRPVIATSDAVVHHGGAGTAFTTTAYGLPQLVLPGIGDQFGHGERLAAVGAGITIDQVYDQDDPARLRAGLDAILNEPSYGKAARELGQEMADMPAPSAVAADLERFVAVS